MQRDEAPHAKASTNLDVPEVRPDVVGIASELERHDVVAMHLTGAKTSPTPRNTRDGSNVDVRLCHRCTCSYGFAACVV
jgi:hypothetical protein